MGGDHRGRFGTEFADTAQSRAPSQVAGHLSLPFPQGPLHPGLCSHHHSGEAMLRCSKRSPFRCVTLEPIVMYVFLRL